jgi:hypothetical protein
MRIRFCIRRLTSIGAPVVLVLAPVLPKPTQISATKDDAADFVGVEPDQFQ